MWIVAIAWIYVVGLMAVTERSIVAGVMTFIGYCVIPLSILFYLTGGRRRRAKRAAQDNANSSDTGCSSGFLSSDSGSSSGSSSDNSSSDDSCSSSDSDSGSSCDSGDSGGGDSGGSSD